VPDRRASRGALAEDHVLKLIQERGWRVVDRNFRIRSGEIDLIAFDGDVLVFVEVRARTGTAFGRADDTVDFRKLEKIMSTALTYIELHPEYAEHFWRVDLFAITLGAGNSIVACRQYENLTLS
jgi:putative endonuclease